MSAHDQHDEEYELEDFLEELSTMATMGLHLLILPGSINLVTIHLMRKIYAERRQKKKRR